MKIDGVVFFIYFCVRSLGSGGGKQTVFCFFRSYSYVNRLSVFSFKWLDTIIAITSTIVEPHSVWESNNHLGSNYKRIWNLSFTVFLSANQQRNITHSRQQRASLLRPLPLPLVLVVGLEELLRCGGRARL